MGVERFLEIVSGAVGLHAGDAAFRALVGPGETEEQQKILEQKSTCALFVRGCLAWVIVARNIYRSSPNPSSFAPSPDWLAYKLDDYWYSLRGMPRRLWAPYVDGMAVADLVATLANTGRDPGRITRGSVVIVGEGRSTHVFVVESIERDGWPDGGYELTAVEAGQVDRECRQCVMRRKHEIVVGDNGSFDCAYERKGPGGAWELASSARRVTHVLDTKPLLDGGAL